MAILNFTRVSSVFLGLSLLLPNVGCGPAEVKIESKSSDEAHKVSGKDQMKARLSEIATSGSGGSAVSGLRDGLLELKKENAALADQLLKDLNKLEMLQDSAEIKALAGQMADRIK